MLHRHLRRCAHPDGARAQAEQLAQAHAGRQSRDHEIMDRWPAMRKQNAGLFQGSRCSWRVMSPTRRSPKAAVTRPRRIRGYSACVVDATSTFELEPSSIQSRNSGVTGRGNRDGSIAGYTWHW
ncbi:hypothetical protein Ato02nite_047710 [Paractinoplanes toevensis]|uniref:Uncharacterized protein n=1 Tax=Paractinoplanes toevensis TaxID=571911 RepID=A0A919TCA9_9ACTN|nr:hypothetical protein Ato02nite_047710 [Actinoplanes toevensis]